MQGNELQIWGPFHKKVSYVRYYRNSSLKLALLRFTVSWTFT